jgi:hypothetical protein
MGFLCTAHVFYKNRIPCAGMQHYSDVVVDLVVLVAFTTTSSSIGLYIIDYSVVVSPM